MTTSPNTATPIEGQEPTNNTGTLSAESKETATSDVSTKDTNTKNDEGASAPSAQPSNKKRRSNIQLNKDDHPEGACNSDDDDGGELNDEGTKRSDPFKRASEDVIKKRKIVKASSKWGSEGNGSTNGGGTFASVNLAAPTENSNKDNTTSIFGSSSTSGTFGSATASTSLGFGGVGGSSTNKSGGFGSGFGSVSSGFGSLQSKSTEKDNSTTTKSTGFGGGFGAVSSGFGSLKSSTAAPSSFGFGTSTTTNNNDTASSPDKTTSTNVGGLTTNDASSPSSKFPTSSVVDTTNGEEDEECMCQVRAKLFKMVQEAKNDDTTDEREAVPSVPSTSGRMELGKTDNDDDVGKNSPEKTKEENAEKKGPNLVQKEAGIGPVRVLKRKSSSTKDDNDKEQSISDSRVVQRQETGHGGQATRVLLNIRLVPKTCSVIRRGDKFVQLNAPNSNGELESSLFKVKTTADADTLENELKDALEDKGEA